MMNLLLLLLSWLPSSPPTLTAFPEPMIEYHYTFKTEAKEIAIIWYYEVEVNTMMIYSSGVQQIRTGTVRTEMTFPWRGHYILVILEQYPGNRIHKYRYRYNVR